MGRKKQEVMDPLVVVYALELGKAGFQPWVRICIPLFKSQEFVNTMLGSLFEQDYPNFDVVIGVPPGDKTHEAVHPDFYKTGRVTFVTSIIPEGHKGRNANFNRKAAADFKLDEPNAPEILAFTDAKTIRETDWISKAVYYMMVNNAEALGGLMISTPEQEGSFLAMFTDGALLTRVPQFGEGFFLTQENAGRTNDLPVTSCLFVTTVAYRKSKGFPAAQYSYEDYMFVQELLDAGIRIFCTSLVKVYHKHRTSLRKMNLEYMRSGLGAAQMYDWYPHSAFARSRLFQVNAVTVAFFMGFITLLYAVLYQQPEILVTLFSLAGVVFAGLGVVNSVKVRHWYGLFFPLLTAYFIVMFAAAFNLYHRLHMADPDKFLQTVLSYNWNMEL